ncbi:nucleoside hydrolase [Staphylococcus canis]|uniref:Ribonucleoside hydrolase RihC n=1 Tax=Staphylococcus canis TaxID=2724942 RepID=A0ABS0T9I3_9STAP|nr:nucleoside hydrolase [Staphylococcus canis]MBI5975400.1 ribonucleoside hydrolase RihC [Staphylococcus canis]
MKRPIIIDTDPGIDDAAAIAFALHHPKLEVKLISTVHGNVNVHQTTRNALKLLQFFSQSIPVVQGQATPLLRKAIHAPHVHGDNGLAGFNFEEPTTTTQDGNPLLIMRDTILNSPQPITLVPIGPLTNIALLLKSFPEVHHHIESIVLMGGSIGKGNVTEAAEFNIYADPEAAHIVFSLDIPITMIGLDIVRKSQLPFTLLPQMKEMNQTGNMLFNLFKHYRNESLKYGLNIYDAYTIMYLCYPDQFETDFAHVSVELNDSTLLGRTYVDFNHPEKSVNVLTYIHHDTFVKYFTALLKYCP